ncbi:hypothetical protein AB0875_01735 [Micromonospora gifhornensis]|uniref:hypothetical protein n=1 Tax=Micromonospora gifhornensis TaxID=84594 RepID=UPI003456ED92
MRRRLVTTALAGVAALAGTLLAAAPAQAETCEAGIDCETDLTFEVTAGPLQITVPDDATLSSGPPGGYASGQIGDVLVEDLRAESGVGWVASVSSSDFTTGTGVGAGETITSDNVYYCSGDADTTGTGTFTPGQVGPCTAPPPPAGVALDAAVTAYSHGTDGSGNNTAAWDPLVTVSIPLQSVAGTFTGTITHSVN